MRGGVGPGTSQKRKGHPTQEGASYNGSKKKKPCDYDEGKGKVGTAVLELKNGKLEDAERHNEERPTLARQGMANIE